MSQLAEALRERVRGTMRTDEPLAPRTALRVGGSADLWFEPASAEDVVACLSFVRERNLLAVVLGGGANTLIGDGGFRGVVLHPTPRLGGLEWVGPAEARLGAGLTGIKALQAARSRGLVGPEPLVGIPGTLGGQVAMNAGTRHGQMSDLLVAVELASAEGLRWVEAAALELDYRHSRLPPGSVVTRLQLRFLEGDARAGDERIRADLAYRRRTQPWAKPNLGSTFKNPPGDFAGRLLERSGLKGERLGGIAFSDLHANFLVNLGEGRAAEAQALMERAQVRVKEATGVALEPELVRWGNFS